MLSFFKMLAVCAWIYNIQKNLQKSLKVVKNDTVRQIIYDFLPAFHNNW